MSRKSKQEAKSLKINGAGRRPSTQKLIVAACLIFAVAFAACKKDKDFSINGLTNNALQFSEAGEGLIKTFDIKTDVEWEILASPHWLEINPASGKGNQTVTATADPNPTTEAREAQVTIAAEGLKSVSFTVKQEAGAVSKAVSVGEQWGILYDVGGNARFEVSLTNIIHDTMETIYTVLWFSDAAGTVAAEEPAELLDLSLGMAVTGADCDLFVQTGATPEGTYYFRIKIEGALSNVATLSIIPMP